ncbi:MAG: peptidoglycan endopeptidase [Deltaproteobacteria bacterium]|nr:MAG: peptidoglycan endopeptidase [Deltaproteobacteria bacterium]
MNPGNFQEAGIKSHFSFSIRFSLLSAIILLMASPALLQAEVRHIVKPGESLYTIGKKYHVNTEEILAANQLSSETIRVGQKIVVPGVEAKRENSVTKNVPPSEGEAAEVSKVPKMHKVKKGETLASIAKKYGLEAAELKEINELKGPKLKAGQVIRLRLEEEEEDFGAEKTGSDKTPAGKQEILSFVPGHGFLMGEKNRELLGRVAKSFMGFRYLRGGSTVNGMDCSSYVQRVYKIFGIDLPRTAREQFRMGYVVAKNALQVGDLVFFKRGKSREPTHVGIYLGDNQYIHTSQIKRQVDVDSLEGRYANFHFVGAKRIEEVGDRNDGPGSEGE